MMSFSDITGHGGVCGGKTQEEGNGRDGGLVLSRNNSVCSRLLLSRNNSVCSSASYCSNRGGDGGFHFYPTPGGGDNTSGNSSIHLQVPTTNTKRNFYSSPISSYPGSPLFSNSEHRYPLNSNSNLQSLTNSRHSNENGGGESDTRSIDGSQTSHKSLDQSIMNNGNNQESFHPLGISSPQSTVFEDSTDDCSSIASNDRGGNGTPINFLGNRSGGVGTRPKRRSKVAHEGGQGDNKSGNGGKPDGSDSEISSVGASRRDSITSCSSFGEVAD